MLSADTKSGVNWRAALVLGLLSSTFSTLVSHLLAGRIGRDGAVDWMVVATIPLRDSVLQIEPSVGVVLAGDPVPSMADILGRWSSSDCSGAGPPA